MKHRIDYGLIALLMVTVCAITLIGIQWKSIRDYLIEPQSSVPSVALPTPYPTTLPLSVVKIKKLEGFLGLHESPLYPYARLIVEEAEKNNIDYRLIPAIAMNESTLCKNIHEDSYNCWGWVIYGNTITRFESYADAIITISRGIRKNYYDKGMSSPAAIMKVYTPSSPDGIWAKKIEWAYRQIDKQ